MSLPNTLDLNRKRGDTKPFRFTIKDESGADQALGGFTFRFTVNSAKKPTDQTTETFQIVGASTASGKFEFGPTAANVNLIGTYYYDAQIIDGAGDIYTVYEGKIKFTQDITKEEV